MRKFTEKVSKGTSLTYLEMREAAERLMSVEVSNEEIASFIQALSIKGESINEITALVRVLKDNAIQIPVNNLDVFDNCGTGGDGSHSFNISTTASFVLAGAGLKIAKHGNRGISSRTGSADVLEELGIVLDFQPKEITELLNQTNIAFLFAPHVHPNMKRIQLIRKSLGKPSIFNIIGPLTNPVALSSQMIGVYDQNRLMDLATVLYRLGRKRAVVLTGPAGMDEASLAGENHLVLMNEGEIIPFTLHAEEVGLPSAPLESIRGGDAKDNAEILKSVLNGVPSPHLDTVLLNAGIGLFAAGVVTTIQEGVHKASESIESGRALKTLQAVVTYCENRQFAKVES
jgi:anthranilate phosphoribosyltransferase